MKSIGKLLGIGVLLGAILTVPAMFVESQEKTKPGCVNCGCLGAKQEKSKIKMFDENLVLHRTLVEPQVQPKQKHHKHPTGRRNPPKHVLEARVEWSKKAHPHLKFTSKRAVPASYDATALGLDTIVLNQGQCGDCYAHSAIEVCSTAQLVAGVVSLKTNPQFTGSVQWTLDCHPEFGGCNGGDEWQVCQTILTTGFPSLADYPGAGQNPGQCNSSAPLKYKISSMGYCDPNAGAGAVASTQAIQNAIMTSGPVSVAVAAGNNPWWDTGVGVDTGTDNGINHAVVLVGWRPSATVPGKVEWKMKNSWDVSWGVQGYGWMLEGADGIGTEAFFVQATPVAPPPPPTPPQPVPPTPPGPVQTVTLQPGQTITVTAAANAPVNGVVITTDMTVEQMVTLLQKCIAAKKNGEPPLANRKAINWIQLYTDISKAFTDYESNATVQVLEADALAILADLGLPTGLLEKMAKKK